MEIKQRNDESFLDYADRLITNRETYDLDKSEVYELLYGKQASSDHCRKALTVLQMTIEEQKKSEVEQIHNDLNDKDLEKELSKNYKSTTEINRDGTQTSDKLIIMSEEESKDVEFLLKSHGFAVKSWELISARNNIWNVYSKQDGVQTLYSSKITVKPRLDNISLEEIKEHFIELTNNYQSPVHIPTRYDVDGKMLELKL